MLHTLLAARPVPTTADWWMVGLTAAAAIGTITAVVVALGIALHDGRRRDAERRDAQAAQARLVHAGELQPEAQPSGDVSHPLVAFPVHNDSDGTVLDLTGALYVSADGGPLQRVQYDPQPRQLRRLAPHSTGKLIFSPIAMAHVRYDVQVEFTDAAGLRWHRRGTAQPVRVLLDQPQDQQP